MRLYFRCSCCRTRIRLSKPAEHYRRAPKCHRCGHRRFYLDRERNGRRPTCWCAGYWFPHRPGSPCCDTRPDAEMHLRIRLGEDRLDVLADMALDGRLASVEPPWA